MKILQVIPYFVPAWDYGGPLRVCYELSKELVRRGQEVTVYTTDTLDANSRVEKKEEVIDGIKVKRFRNLSNTLACKHNIFLPLDMLLVIKKELPNFNVIHMHDYRTMQNVIVHHCAKKDAIPYVFQAHGALPRIAAKQRSKYVYDAIWGRKLLEDASKVIALTEAEAERYKSMGVSKERIEIVPNGIALSEFDNLPERGEFRKKYGLNDNEKIILYLGRIHQTKGIDLLARAFAALSANFNDAKLVIIGPDDGYLPALKELINELGIEERVLFAGPLYKEEKIKAYIDADVFVTPSFYGFPVTFLEACACGLPVITTQVGDTLDWLDGQAGLVVPYDKEQLRDALLHILGDDKIGREFGEKGRLLVREKFNWVKIAGQVEKVYQSVIQV